MTKKEMTEQLKPCPFCCGEAEIQTDDKLHLWRVICLSDSDEGMGSLEISTCWFSSIESAVETWNNRPIEDAKDDENKRLREALERIADVGSWKKYNDVLYIGDKPLYKVAFDALKGDSK